MADADDDQAVTRFAALATRRRSRTVRKCSARSAGHADPRGPGDAAAIRSSNDSLTRRSRGWPELHEQHHQAHAREPRSRPRRPTRSTAHEAETGQGDHGATTTAISSHTPGRARPPARSAANRPRATTLVGGLAGRDKPRRGVTGTLPRHRDHMASTNIDRLSSTATCSRLEGSASGTSAMSCVRVRHAQQPERPMEAAELLQRQVFGKATNCARLPRQGFIGAQRSSEESLRR